MKRQCQIRRHLVAMPDGQQRWDRAYQALPRWTEPATVIAVTTSQRADVAAHVRGAADFCRRVHAGLAGASFA